MERMCLLWLVLLALAASAAMSVAPGQEAKKEKGEAATLVIVASGPGGGLNTNEFITLQQAKSQIKWTATAMGEDPVQGTLEAQGLNFAQVFDRVSRLAKQTKQNRNSSPHYSLLLIGPEGAKTCVGLDLAQRRELGKENALGPVFTKIVERFVYAKANMMLPIVIPDYVPMEVTAPTTRNSQPFREEIPKTRR